jgi:hypothetical protein
MNKVALGPPGPPPPPKPPDTKQPPEPPLDVPKELAFARSSMQAQNFTNVLSSAQKILRAQPGNREAMRMTGVAACRLHQYDIAKDILAKHPPRAMELAIRKACGNAID